MKLELENIESSDTSLFSNDDTVDYELVGTINFESIDCANKSDCKEMSKIKGDPLKPLNRTNVKSKQTLYQSGSHHDIADSRDASHGKLQTFKTSSKKE